MALCARHVITKENLLLFGEILGVAEFGKSAQAAIQQRTERLYPNGRVPSPGTGTTFRWASLAQTERKGSGRRALARGCVATFCKQVLKRAVLPRARARPPDAAVSQFCWHCPRPPSALGCRLRGPIACAISFLRSFPYRGRRWPSEGGRDKGGLTDRRQ